MFYPPAINMYAFSSMSVFKFLLLEIIPGFSEFTYTFTSLMIPQLLSSAVVIKEQTYL